MITVQLFDGRDDQFYLRFVSENGQVLLTSEGYTRHWSGVTPSALA